MAGVEESTLAALTQPEEPTRDGRGLSVGRRIASVPRSEPRRSYPKNPAEDVTELAELYHVVPAWGEVAVASRKNHQRLLVVDTHSDDSAISSGGFLEKFRHCYEYHFVLAACSDIRLHHSGSLLRESRLAEYEQFVNHFRGVWHRDDDLPFDADSRMDQVPKREVVTALEGVISDIEPEVMIVHGPSFHQDHTAVYEATIAAIRPTARFRPAEIYVAENPTYFHSLGPHTDMRPDFFVSFNRVQMKQKIECFRKCFPSQIRERGNYLSPEGIRSWARYRGIEARCEYAEAFKTFVRVV